MISAFAPAEVKAPRVKVDTVGSFSFKETNVFTVL